MFLNFLDWLKLIFFFFIIIKTNEITCQCYYYIQKMPRAKGKKRLVQSIITFYFQVDDIKVLFNCFQLFDTKKQDFLLADDINEVLR